MLWRGDTDGNKQKRYKWTYCCITHDDDPVEITSLWDEAEFVAEEAAQHWNNEGGCCWDDGEEVEFILEDEAGRRTRWAIRLEMTPHFDRTERDRDEGMADGERTNG